MAETRTASPYASAIVEQLVVLFRLSYRIPLFFVWTIFMFLLCVVSLHRRPRAKVASIYFRAVLHLFGFRVRLNRKSMERGAIIMPTHTSYLDIAIVSAYFKGYFVSTIDIKNWPIFGWGNSMIGSIYVNRGQHGMVDHVLKAGTPVLKNKENLFIFAEGKASPTPVLPLKRGAFVLAEHNHAPIVPVTVRFGDLNRTAWAIHGKNSGFYRHLLGFIGATRKERVTVTVMPTVYSDYFENEDMMREKVRDAMQRVYDDDSLNDEDLEAMDLYGLERQSKGQPDKASRRMGVPRVQRSVPARVSASHL